VRTRLSPEDVEEVREGARNLAMRLLFDEAERLLVVKPGQKAKQKHKLLARELESIARSIVRQGGAS